MFFDEVLNQHHATIGVALGAIVFTIYLWGTRYQSQAIKPLLHKTEFRKFKLIKKEILTHNTAIYRFELPAGTGLNLPIGQHVSVKAAVTEDGKEVMRSYTPISLNDDKGHFDLLIKTYPTGVLSKHFASLQLGDELEVRGPKGNFLYTPNMCREIGMLAGGTGITPMFQIIQAVLKNPADKTRISLVFGNVTEEDILLRQRLTQLEKDHPEQLKVYHVLNNPPAGWTQGSGFINADVIKQYCPAPAKDVKILICGPPPMVKAMQATCEQLGYEPARPVSKLEDQVFKF
ncbi:hypothetical protein MIR68_004799 [Amoeboaphelidium protococcarum]|nr:hypothetical protein MIR68_004799 [Amoeboaphelidium protococcarum]